MNALKTLFTVAVLGAAGFALYRYFNVQEPADPPEEFLEAEIAPPNIELGGLGGSPGAAPAGAIESGPPSFAQPGVPSGGNEMNGNTTSATTPAIPAGSGMPGMTGMKEMTGMTGASAAAGPAASPSIPPSATASGSIPPTDALNPSSGPRAVDPATVLGAAYPGAASGETTAGQATTTPASGEPMNSTGAMTGASASAIPPSSESNPASSSSAYAATRNVAQTLLDKGEMAQALMLLSRWYGDPSLTEQQSKELSTLLSQLAGTVIYSREHLLEPAYRAQPGDTLETIAQAYQVPWQLLARINGVTEPTAISAGQELKVVRGPFSATVSTDRKELVLTVGVLYAGRFPIEIGEDRKSIEGTWEVNQKQVKPTYYGDGVVIEAGDPNNPLGEYLVGLVNLQAGGASRPFGIHGSPPEGATAGKDTRGFIRLSAHDAEDIHGILSVGSRVTIRR